MKNKLVLGLTNNQLNQILGKEEESDKIQELVNIQTMLSEIASILKKNYLVKKFFHRTNRKLYRTEEKNNVVYVQYLTPMEYVKEHGLTGLETISKNLEKEYTQLAQENAQKVQDLEYQLSLCKRNNQLLKAQYG